MRAIVWLSNQLRIVRLRLAIDKLKSSIKPPRLNGYSIGSMRAVIEAVNWQISEYEKEIENIKTKNKPHEQQKDTN